MKFILNTAVDLHFCALFDEAGKRLFFHKWEDCRQDGQELWEFLQQHDVSKFTFLGGVSGPGGFSSLRVGAGVLNSLAFSLQLPVHSVRADFWQESLLKETGEVILNSFGDGVWVRRGKDLVRKSAKDAGSDFLKISACISWLPEGKAQQFENPILVEMKNAPEVLLQLLETVDAHPQCVTEYEVPAI